ncbi:MAG: GntR family transcriptional regulator [Lachnospiraceae bacterium]|nr:GntR family transcriptional regulator [Lachnospiraceae bacterium]
MQNSKYEIITDYIKKKIAAGSLKDGDKVPSENALTNKFGVSRDTVRRGFKALELEGILVSKRGSGTFVRLRKGFSSDRIAVVTTYVENYIFPKIIKGIEATLSQKGYSMQLSFTDNQFEKEREVLTDILAKEDVAGIIMEPVKSALPNPNLEIYESLREKGVPVLFINTYYRETDIPHVSLNDEAMAYMATRYLIAKGHKRIGAILKMDDGQGHLRFAGYRQALYEQGEKNPSDFVVWYDTSDEGGNDMFDSHLMKRLKDCTAVFCYNDKVAREFINYLQSKGKKVPEDVSVISMDDSDLARLGDVKITSCPHPMAELGRVAAENLIKLIDNPKFDATKEFITEVKERGSVKNI